MGQLDGKVAFITGGGRGQGRTHATTLAREGADIAICDVELQLETAPYEMNAAGDMDETKRQVEALGRRCLAINADVRDSVQIDDAIARAIAELGGLDILCANAAMWGIAELVDTTDELWHDTIETNLSGVFYPLRAAARYMRDQGSGRIVLTSSMCGRQGTPNMGAYVASKWGVLGLVKTAAIELGPYNVGINGVCPTFVDTTIINHDAYNRLFRPDLENPTKETSEEVVRTLHKMPVGSYSPQEVSNAVLFLVSEAARYITGTAIDITAGKGAEWSA
ncbi:MAG TPA: mycofactocin-coupled SDR family oxidoreductase [Solirubrobacteraceae bacterium]|jgi:SDR family mycofactocin-dependent oxidoreductase